MVIRLAEVFDEKADAAVANQIKGHHCPSDLNNFSQSPQYPEEKKSFEKGFVQLGWMAHLRSGSLGKIHAKRHRSRPAVKFTVDKVSKAAKGITQRDSRYK